MMPKAAEQQQKRCTAEIPASDNLHAYAQHVRPAETLCHVESCETFKRTPGTAAIAASIHQHNPSSSVTKQSNEHITTLRVTHVEAC